MIRIATKEDIPAILDIYAPYIQNTTATFEYTVPTEAEFTARFQGVTRQFPWLVWEEDGLVLGYAYGSAPFERAAYQWCAELSVYLAPQIQGKGIGKMLYTALEKLLYLQGYRVLYALICDENDASIGFHKKMGYKTVTAMPRCGVKFGRWIGIIYMEKRADSVEIPSFSPISFPDFVHSNRKGLEFLAILSLP